MSDAVADPFAEAFAQAEPPAVRPQPAAAAELPELSPEDIAAARSQTAQARAAAPAPAAAVNQVPGEHVSAPQGAAQAAAAPLTATPPDEAFPAWREALLAWHRRMPLARRLQPEQLSGVGLVRLAFQPPATPGGVAMPLFKSERLVAGLSAKALPAFADALGFAERPGPADWPLRELGPADPAHSGPVQWRYLITAAYPGLLKAPARALMGRSPDGVWQVRGRRGLSRGRVGALVGGVVVLVAVAAALALWWLRPSGPAATARAAAAAASAAASAVAVAHAASAAASGAPVHDEAAAAAEGHAHGTATADLRAETGAAAASAPVAAEHAASAAASSPSEGPGKTASTAAAAESEEAPPPPRPQVVQPLPGAKAKRPLHALPEKAASPAATTGAAAAATLRYALVSAPSADPAPLQMQRRRLRQALGREGEHLRLELMPAPGGQALTLWPLPDQRAAEALAQTLRQAGIPMRPVAF